jgi:hypothetical protein
MRNEAQRASATEAFLKAAPTVWNAICRIRIAIIRGTMQIAAVMLLVALRRANSPSSESVENIRWRIASGPRVAQSGKDLY